MNENKMINVEYEYIELKDGKRIESRVFYEIHIDDKNYKDKLQETLKCILDTTEDLSYIGFGLIRDYYVKSKKKGDD